MLKGFWPKATVEECVGEKLMLVVTEIAEAMEETRKPNLSLDEDYELDGKPEGFGIELADAVIRIADLAQAAGVDLQTLIEKKMAYNETRPHRHGKMS